MIKELLAPAGDIEAGYAALYYGADAVYLGLQKFSARATATNFDEPHLNEFVAFAHSLTPRRRVYAAINTVVQESELDDLISVLEICKRCQVDGVIVQDLGVAKIVRDYYPELELHASTQMAVHNKDGALALQKFGFKRVVVARELTQSEIAEIAAIPDLDVEAFVHGALCYSYSGLCLFSSLETGKSANRGKCLYPCRALFKGESGEKHYFSMKDMALAEDVLKMPAYSLKIEGRKKSALYVAAVTDFYRRLLDSGKADKMRAQNIKQIFSRPWCEFHFRGRDKNVIDRDFVGHRGLEIGTVLQADARKIVFEPSHRIARHDGLQLDVKGDEKPFGFALLKMRVNGKNVFEAKAGEKVEVALPPKAPNIQKGDKVYLASASEVKGAYPYTKPKPGEFRLRNGVAVKVMINADDIEAKAAGRKVQISGKWDKAQNPDKVEAAVRQAFAKTGDTPFEVVKLELRNDGNWFVPVSVLNNLRREMFNAWEPEDNPAPEIKQPQVRERHSPQWIIKTDKPEVLRDIDLSEAAEVVVYMGEDFDFEVLKSLPKNKVRLALPAVCRRKGKMTELITAALQAGYKKWEVDNYWGIAALPEKGIDLSLGRSIYMLNTQAMAAAKEWGASRVALSVEDTLENWQKLAELAPLPVVLTVYEKVPLFISAGCIRDNPCKGCDRKRKWMNLQREGRQYQVLSENCQTMVFDERPLCVAKEAAGIAADFYQAVFMFADYTPDEVAQIWQQLRKFDDVSGEVMKANTLSNRVF